MISNYTKIAWRNLIRNRSYGLVNIFGLTVGLAVVILITLWIKDELTFDHSFKNHDRIAQVLHQSEMDGQVGTGSGMPMPLAEVLRNDYKNDLEHVALSLEGQYNLTYKDKKFSVKGMFAEASWPGIFSLDLVHGSADALKDPSSVLLSETLAEKLFGKDNPVDEVIRVTSRYNLRVGGVYRDLPANTSFNDVSFVAPWEFLVSNWDWVKDQSANWEANMFDLTVQLAATADKNDVSKKIKNVLANNREASREKTSLLLFPMSRWHLHGDFNSRGENSGGAIQYVWLFGIVGFLVLLLACINFMNLSTARAEKRAKEVGIRKTLGSGRKQLIYQFFSESFFAVIISFLLSLIIVWTALPWFNGITGKSMDMPWFNAPFWITGLAICAVTGTLAGSYPAFYLSSFKPVKVLKGLFKVGAGANIPRKVLVVFQFSISIFLIISTVVIFKQIQFAKDRPVGYDRNGLLSIQMTTGEIYGNYKKIKDELLRSGAISGITQAQSPVTDIWTGSGGFEWKGKKPETQDGFATVFGSHEYGKVVGWEFVDGRGFDKTIISDSMALVVNESAVKHMGLENPVGETVYWRGVPHTIIGVVRDVMMTSPFGQSIPTVFPLLKEGGNYVVIRLNPDISMSEAIQTIGASFAKHNPFAPFEYTFVDDDYAVKFKYEERIGTLSVLFSALAIFISLLGLFGIASFMADRRTKEIGIRKVLGASVLNLWNMLSRELMLLILVAVVIALPLGYWAMSQWLNKYEYRFVPGWWVFLMPVVAALSVALLTISLQTIKAAKNNPVNALR